MWIYICFIALHITTNNVVISEACVKINEISIVSFSRYVIPSMNGKHKGEAGGKIGVIGGSIEYTGSPYYAAMSALKVGADSAHVITTESASPVIKSYSPDLLVYPFLSIKCIDKVKKLLRKMDIVIIGPGLGRENNTLNIINKIIEICKSMQKPLVIDANGLYVISKNISLIEQYPQPGIILTPNHLEAKRLKDSVHLLSNTTDWYNFWGKNISVLIKGESDQFYSNHNTLAYDWKISEGGSGRRAGGQGDILAGFLGTFYGWALNSNICCKNESTPMLRSLAAYAAATLTRKCNFLAFEEHGRSMTASDMLKEIHSAFENVIVI